MKSRTTKTTVAIIAAGFLSAGASWAQTVNVATDASFTANYVGTIQNGGPFPWSDLGVTATAVVAPGDLNVATGGATSFDLTNAPVGGPVLGFHTKCDVN
jgi:hypothetical protein